MHYCIDYVRDVKPIDYLSACVLKLNLSFYLPVSFILFIVFLYTYYAV